MRKPNLHGKVVVQFIIEMNGSVSSCDTKNSTMDDSTVESCINRRIRTWTFPKPSGGIVQVEYPFIFASTGGG